jgi:hypothetical protein
LDNSKIILIFVAQKLIKNIKTMKELIFALLVTFSGLMLHIFGYGDLGNYMVIVFFSFLIMGHIDNIEDKLKNK